MFVKQWKKSVAMVLGIVIGITVCGGGIRLAKAAQTYYVSQSTGNDANVGTSKSKAFKTLKKAVTEAEEGDAIRILDTLYQMDSLNISKGVTIGRAAGMTDYMIVLEKGAELTLRGEVVLTGRKSSVPAQKPMIKVKEGATLHVKGKANLKNNLSKTLPGGAVVNHGTMNISGNCVFENNTTGSYGGGAIYNIGILNMDGGIIRNNAAGMASVVEAEERCGGGVLNGGIFTMTGGTISQNTSIGGGGGVYSIEGSSFVFSNGIITKNKSEKRGGGVNCSGSTFTMNGGEVSYNTSIGGGGIHLGRENAGNVISYSTISGGDIIGNKSILISEDATVGCGGGILVRNNSVLTISGGVISDNVSENCGGGLRIGENGKVIINGSQINISGNSAEKGGGIQIKTGGTLQYVKGIVINNTATLGGGVHIKGNCEVTGGRILDNSANKGSAIFHNGSLELSGSVTIDEEDDIYLCEEKYVILPSELTTSQGKIILTPSNYVLGRVCARTTKASTKANAYRNQFVLAENAPYLLRPGDFLVPDAGVKNTDLIISRGYNISYRENIKQEVFSLPEDDVMYWKETYAISKMIPEWSKLSRFIAWNTDKSGKGKVYTPGETIFMPQEELTLFAQWSNLPPEITAQDSYLVEDEIATRFTKAFLRAYGEASDPEEGDISEDIEITNWEEILQKIQEPYSEEEKQLMERHIDVEYCVSDSLGATAQTKARLTVFLVVENKGEKKDGYVRFLEEEYVEVIEENTFWGSAEMKAYLKELLRKDTSDVEWEN